ncbi:hypothetical protein GCM10011384_21060 [Psychrobacillus lasiicapitis]|nr:hypothetical protein GCM10011384_21060 [Psychrobacillus lasiicapitis]
MKEMRGEQTQLSLGLDINLTRETVSKYENGRSKVPSDISRTLVNKYDNPKFAMTIRNEYTGTGPKWLDGPNVDLHRSSVKEKTLEELREALETLESFSLAKPLKKLQLFERQLLERVLDELVEAQTAIDHMVAVVCKEADISYTGVWDKHYRSLASAGYIGGAK